MRDVTSGLRLRRFAVVELIQLPFVLLAILGAWPWALFTAALIGSVICAAGTDSASGPGATLARWLNRVLVLQAIAWLTIALVFCLPS
jgi:branched-subunit amino acid transport protein